MRKSKFFFSAHKSDFHTRKKIEEKQIIFPELQKMHLNFAFFCKKNAEKSCIFRKTLAHMQICKFAIGTATNFDLTYFSF